MNSETQAQRFTRQVANILGQEENISFSAQAWLAYYKSVAQEPQAVASDWTHLATLAKKF